MIRAALSVLKHYSTPRNSFWKISFNVSCWSGRLWYGCTWCGGNPGCIAWIGALAWNRMQFVSWIYCSIWHSRALMSLFILADLSMCEWVLIGFWVLLREICHGKKLYVNGLNWLWLPMSWLSLATVLTYI